MTMRSARYLTIAAVVLLVSCGGSHGATFTTAATSRDTDSGWVVTTSREADYLSFVELDGQVTGTVQVAGLDAAGTTVITKPFKFTGRHTGKQISLNVEGRGIWHGVLDDGRLVLDIPQPDGTIAAITFVPGGIDLYNTAVAALQHSAAVAEASIAVSNAQVAHDKELVDALARLRGLTASLRGHRATLADELTSYALAAHETMSDAAATVDEALKAHPPFCLDIRHALDDVGHVRDDVGHQRTEFESQIQRIDQTRQDVLSTITAVHDLNPAVDTADSAVAASEVPATISAARSRADQLDADADTTLAAATAKVHAVCPAG